MWATRRTTRSTEREARVPVRRDSEVTCPRHGATGSSTTQDPSNGATGTADVTIVASTTVLGDVTREIVGDAGQVVTLMPAGADPYSFQPSAQQLAQMQDADLIVDNGANLVESLAEAISETRSAGVPIFSAIDSIAGPLSFDDDHAHDEAHEQDEEPDERDAQEDSSQGGHAQNGAIDPHFWLDPTRMSDVTRALGDEIAQVLDDEAVGLRADEYATMLAGVDERVEATLSMIPDERRVLVTNHDALEYFADRYDFRVVATVIPGPTTGAEPSAQDLDELTQTIRATGAAAVFAETTQPDQLANTVAQEVGKEVAVVDLFTGSLGAGGSGAETYVGMLETNAERIADALGG